MQTVDPPSPPLTPHRMKAPTALSLNAHEVMPTPFHFGGSDQASVSNPPKSPGDEYRRLRTEKHCGSRSPRPSGLESKYESPSRVRASKMPRVSICCSLCGGLCKTHRTVGLGSRIAIALISREFVRGLAGKLVACDSCAKAMSRSMELLVELEKIVVSVPELNIDAAPLLRVQNIRPNIQALAKTYLARPLDVEVQLRLLPPSNGWSILSAFSDGGVLELLKDPKDNHYGVVELCRNPVDRVAGSVTVQDRIGRTPFKVSHWRLMPQRDPGVTAGVAAAPRAKEAAKHRADVRLKIASEAIAVLQGANASLQVERQSACSEVIAPILLVSYSLSLCERVPLNTATIVEVA